jgi:hypothetical protein
MTMIHDVYLSEMYDFNEGLVINHGNHTHTKHRIMRFLLLLFSFTVY